MKRLYVALAAVGAAACGGLLVDRGNNFPCDFSLPEGERDQACSKGEVCGVDNLCRPFTYEGPQFEGGLRLPKLDGGTAQLHPGEFRDDVWLLARNSAVAEGLAAVTAAPGGPATLWALQRSSSGATVSPVRIAGAEAGQLAKAKGLAVAVDRGWGTPEGAVYVRPEGVLTSRTILVAPGGATQEVRNALGLLPAAAVMQLRAAEGIVLTLGGALLNGWDVDLLGTAANGNPALLRFADSARDLDGGVAPLPNIYDVRLLPASAFGANPALQLPPAPVALARQGIYRVGCVPVLPPYPPPYCWVPLLSDPGDALSFATLAGPGAELRVDPSGHLWAVVNGMTLPQAYAPRTVLSAWTQVKRPGLFGGRELVRAWPDCTPCKNGNTENNTVVAVVPAAGGQDHVDVLCRQKGLQGGDLFVVRVVGSSASDPAQGCETAPVTPHFRVEDFSQVDLRVPSFDGGQVDVTFLTQDWAGVGDVVFGGKRGRVWAGPDFDRAPPITLDHVPLATGTLPAADGTLVPAAVTDRYLAARMGDAGFVTLDIARLADFPLDGVTVRTLAGEAPGWAVLSSADVLQVDWVQDGGTPNRLRARFGPRLLDSSDLPAKPPYNAEAFNGRDGGLVSFLFTAFDSVYLGPADPGSALSSTPAATALRPDVTPEPNSPIRSFALERSVLGTDGRTRVRAYATTARNLYLVQLSGTPPRWTATQLVLTGDAPVGTWMDHPRGGLARVGYTSGEVYTLPGAFPLVRSLVQSGVVDGAGGTAVKVDQYENLGGWPVAYSKAGVFVASYGLLAPGKYDNRTDAGVLGKPMTWKRVRLDDGSEPWVGQAGRLQVVHAPGSNVFELLVYTADGAWKVLTFDRAAPAD